MDASDELRHRAELKATELIDHYAGTGSVQVHLLVAAAYLHGMRDGLLEGAEMTVQALEALR